MTLHVLTPQHVADWTLYRVGFLALLLVAAALVRAFVMYLFDSSDLGAQSYVERGTHHRIIRDYRSDILLDADAENLPARVEMKGLPE